MKLVHTNEVREVTVALDPSEVAQLAPPKLSVPELFDLPTRMLLKFTRTDETQPWTLMFAKISNKYGHHWIYPASMTPFILDVARKSATELLEMQ